MARRFGHPGPELQDVPGMGTVTSRGVSAISWTDECGVVGFDVAVVLFLRIF